MIDQLCEIAAGAGEVILRHYRRPIRVIAKADRSVLSEADQASHEDIIGALERLTPGWPIVSEESGDKTQAVNASWERYWLVDPLDGTKEFLKGTNEFTVNIALIEAGRPILGVVLAPALSLTYYGSRAGGAWLKRAAAAPIPIRTRAVDPDHVALVASKDHAGPQVSRLLARIPNAKLESMGSSLKFCLVAEGKADLYLRDLPTMEWDTGAAQCIVEAAGGCVCDLDGEPLMYGKKELRNPSLITLGDSRLCWKSLLT